MHPSYQSNDRIPKLLNPLRYLTGSTPELPLPTTDTHPNIILINGFDDRSKTIGPFDGHDLNTYRDGNQYSTIRSPKIKHRPALLSITRPSVESGEEGLAFRSTTNSSVPFEDLPFLSYCKTASSIGSILSPPPSTERSIPITSIPSSSPSTGLPNHKYTSSYDSFTMYSHNHHPHQQQSQQSVGNHPPRGIRHRPSLSVAETPYGRDEIGATNHSFRRRLDESRMSLRGISDCWEEMDMNRTEQICDRWEAGWDDLAEHIVDYEREGWLDDQTRIEALRTCTECLALEIPRVNIWKSSVKIRQVLDPDTVYNDWCEDVPEVEEDFFAYEHQMRAESSSFASRRHSNPVGPSQSQAQGQPYQPHHHRSFSHQFSQARAPPPGVSQPAYGQPSTSYHHHNSQHRQQPPPLLTHDLGYFDHRRVVSAPFSPSATSHSSSPWTPMTQSNPVWGNATVQDGEWNGEEEDEEDEGGMFPCDR